MIKYKRIGDLFLIKNQFLHRLSPISIRHVSHLDLIEQRIKHIPLTSKYIDIEHSQLDWNYLLNFKNKLSIENDYLKRNGIHKLNRPFPHHLYKKLVDVISEINKNNQSIEQNLPKIDHMIQEMYTNALSLPNNTDPDTPIGFEKNANCVEIIGEKSQKKKFRSVNSISEESRWLIQEQIGLFATQRAYILKGDLAHLEDALVKYTLNYLQNKGFILVSVPELLNRSIIESCGFSTEGTRSQVYKTDYLKLHGLYCLSGTSEMALAGLLRNRVLDENELPLKLCAVSRCYRAEVSGSGAEGKLYRLHEFTKVEMFIVTKPDLNESKSMLNQIKSYQIELFKNLDLHFKVLDMPSEELGLPAYKKYDIEAWMPYTQRYGEISSSSNCTDYQSRRLNIKINSKNKNLFAHTLNGTACAVPRLLTTIIENNWDEERKLVQIPAVLRPYMNDQETMKLGKHEYNPEIKQMRRKKF